MEHCFSKNRQYFNVFLSGENVVHKILEKFKSSKLTDVISLEWVESFDLWMTKIAQSMQKLD